MFADFFLQLRSSGIPVNFKSFLTLQKALDLGLISGMYDFYISARSILVKSERYFDLYDRNFSAYFEESGDADLSAVIPDKETAELLKKWLETPASDGSIPDESELQLRNLTPKQLMEYYNDRLNDQKDRHDFGKKWIGTSGKSPTGHSGYYPSGMRVGGKPSQLSAMKVAGDRRYKDYSADAPLSASAMTEALKRLRNMVPHGPEDTPDIPASIKRTMENCGDIEIVFKQSLRNKLKVILAVDNGGISMDPYVNTVKRLFDHADSYFKDLKIFYFHNVIYDRLWSDPSRTVHPVKTAELLRLDPASRLIIVGDASMSPYELLYREGIIHTEDRADAPGLYYLKALHRYFRHSVWLNPVPDYLWQYTSTIGIVKDIFPMFEISLNGLDKAVEELMAK